MRRFIAYTFFLLTLFQIYRVSEADSLRKLAEQNGFYIGAAVRPQSIANEPIYAETLAREFNMLIAENVMKMHAIQPRQGEFHFDPADRLVEFAQQNDMAVRGHTLVWHLYQPKWLTEKKWTRDELIEVMRTHIHTVLSRYKGKIYGWDVVNEAVDENQPDGLRRSFWYEAIGPDYIDLAFQFAHEADPDTKLIYNDFEGEGMGKKSDFIFNLVKEMKERGVPIDGVGLQMHIRAEGDPEPNEVSANNHRLGELGLETHITEIDVRLPKSAPRDALDLQAVRYREILRACLESPNCKAFVLWGFTDKYSWVPKFFPGFDKALIFDENNQPKPAYEKMQRVLMDQGKRDSK